jgi:hypothetical protein
MAEIIIIEHDGDGRKLPTSADEALLDEFFSIIANIAMRLTKDGSRYNNIAMLSTEEGENQ